MTRRLTRIGNRIGVALYRGLDGRLSSGSRDVHVLLITTPGRRTGRPRSTCVRYLDTAEGWLVWGSGSGSPRDPDWFQNLRTAGRADVQVRADRFEVEARELEGARRDDVWRQTVLVEAPEVAKFARRAGRTIPVAVLVLDPCREREGRSRPLGLDPGGPRRGLGRLHRSGPDPRMADRVAGRRGHPRVGGAGDDVHLAARPAGGPDGRAGG